MSKIVYPFDIINKKTTQHVQNMSITVIHEHDLYIIFTCSMYTISSYCLFIKLLHHPIYCHLEKTTVLQIVLDDDISYSIKYKLDVVCVRCACEVGVDFFGIFSFV